MLTLLIVFRVVLVVGLIAAPMVNPAQRRDYREYHDQL